MIRKTQFCNHLFICAKDRNPDYPGSHAILNPKGSGLVVVGAHDRKVLSGFGFARHIGKPISQLTWQLRDLTDTRIIIDPIGLNPDSMYYSIRSLLRRTGATLNKRCFHRWPFHIVFWVSDPEMTVDDPVIYAITRSLINLAPPPVFEYYWPSLAKEAFAEIFGYIHPDYSSEEAKEETRRLSKEAIRALRKLDLGTVEELLTRMRETLGEI